MQENKKDNLGKLLFISVWANKKQVDQLLLIIL